jgi:serine/threonine protein kinase
LALATHVGSRFSITSDLHPGYRLRRLRGRGGYGEVWEAEKEGSATPVALKFLPCVRGQGVTHELRSIQIIQGMPHPNLTTIDRVWCAGGFVVVAMELADGNLSDLLNVYQSELGTGLPAEHLLHFLAQAADALDYLNTRQHLHQGQWVTIQHCDISPTNVLVFDKTVKLSDFGLTTTLSSRSKVHMRAGTPYFAAPEVFVGEVSDRTDQYSFAMCYCMLRGGRLPFADLPPDFQTVYNRPAPDLEMLDAVERPAVARALSIAPQDRWPTCQQLIAELRKATSPPRPAGSAIRQDTRRHVRYPSDRRVTCEVLESEGNQRWQAMLQNVSPAGARVRIVRPGCEIKPGRVLQLMLCNKSRGVRIFIRLRLTHSTDVDGDVEAGGSFDRPLTAEELVAVTENG